MNLKIGEAPMTHIEAKHRVLIKSSLEFASMVRYDSEIENSKSLVHGFLIEMKNRR